MKKFSATLITPPSLEAKKLGLRQRTRLSWTMASRYGLGVLLYATGEILDGFNFRGLRDAVGARIETTDPVKVCRGLGVPVGEPGVEVRP
jgi:hypothetical protein